MNSHNSSDGIAQTALEKSNLIIVTGIQWWDEWKGKAVSSFQWKNIDYIVWAYGGGNAWHTVFYKWKKLDFHELPGGSIIEWARIYLAKWKVIQISTLGNEMRKLEDVWIDLKNKITIGGGAQVVLKSFQQKIDAEIEKLRWCNAVGTTMKGIGPSYAGEALRIGFTIKELLTMNNQLIQGRIRVIAGLFPWLSIQDMLIEILQEKRNLKDWIHDGIISIDFDDMDIYTAHTEGKSILVEQSQSFLLGKEAGAYPNCTSSDTSINGILSYMNLPYNVAPVVIGTAKAIMSKVWAGYFPTKMWHEDKYIEFEKEFARNTGELGVTTGRLRDLGWVDIPAIKHATNINPLHILLITKWDVLATLAKEQQKAWLREEMRFYKEFRSSNNQKVYTSGMMNDPSLVGSYSSINLSPTSTEQNITTFGKAIWESLSNFSWPIYFWTGPKEDDIIQFR